jgi:hypothetical protein
MSVLPTKNTNNNKKKKPAATTPTTPTTTPKVRFGPDADYPKGRGPSTNERGVLDQVHHTPRGGGHPHHQQQHQPVVKTTPLANTIRELEQEWEQDMIIIKKMKDKKSRSSVQNFYQREWKDEEQPPPPPQEEPRTMTPPVTNNNTTKKTSPTLFFKDIMSIDEINQFIQDIISKHQMATASEESKCDNDYYYHDHHPAAEAATESSSTTIVSSEMQVELEFDAGLRWPNLLDPPPPPETKDFLHDLELSFSTWNCLLSA